MFQQSHAGTLPSNLQASSAGHNATMCHGGMATSVHAPMADRSVTEPLRPQSVSQGRAAAYQERKQRQACVKCWLTAVHVSLTFCLMCICVIIFLRLKVHQEKLEKLEMSQGSVTRSVSREGGGRFARSIPTHGVRIPRAICSARGAASGKRCRDPAGVP